MREVNLEKLLEIIGNLYVEQYLGGEASRNINQMIVGYEKRIRELEAQLENAKSQAQAFDSGYVNELEKEVQALKMREKALEEKAAYILNLEKQVQELTSKLKEIESGQYDKGKKRIKSQPAGA